MAGETVYRQKVTFCGKPGCRPCQEGRGHGPYWYAYQTVNGQAKQVYIGKTLPPDIEAGAAFPAALIRLHALGQVRLERRAKTSEESWYPVRDATWNAPIRILLGALASSQERRLSLSQVRELLGAKTASTEVQRVIDRLQHLLEPPRRANQQHILMTRLVDVAPDSLSLADQSRLWIDADAFESLIAQAHTAADQPGEQERLLTEALSLYRGDYWPAAAEREAAWVLARRQGLRRQWLGLLLDLAELRRGCGATEGAMNLLDQLFTVDPTNEIAAQRLMLLLAQSGRRGEALRLYQRFTATLAQDEHMLPAAETQRLYEAIRSGETPQHLPTQAILSPQHPHLEIRAGTPLGRSNQSRLVGRDQELAILRQLLLATQQQHQQIPCVLLTGEAGIGKTRLVEELGREAEQRGWAIAWGRTYVQEVGIPYRLWTEALRKVMRQVLGLRQELARRPLLFQPLLALLPDLEDLLPPEQAAVSSEQDQLRLWEAIRALLLAISETTPLLIVLDDVQWADSSSCDLLAHLVRQLRDSPVLIACTMRESELPPTHPLHAVLRDLQREQAIETVTVPPLSDEQIRALVSTLPEQLVHDIQLRAAGNPFFAEELARSADNVLLSHLPDTVAAVLDLRLSRVSDACQRLLVRASVLGGSFEFGALRAMESGPGARDEDVLLDLLEEALQAGVLLEEGSGTRTTYAFWHPLAVSHLYARLSAVRRSNLHRRAAEALQESYAGREQEGAAAIVYHLTSGGGDPMSIASFAELAGDRAYRLSAYPDAERYYRLVTEQRGQLPLPSNGDERLHQALVFERLGECAMVQGHYDEARQCYERVLEARSPQENTSLDAYEAQVQALVWSEIAWAWRYTGETKQAWQCCERGEALLRTAGVVAGSAWASLLYQHGNFAWQESRYQEAEQAAREALALFEEHLRQATPPRAGRASTRLQRTLEGDPVNPGRVHILLAAIQATIGQSDAAASHLQTALVIFEQEDRQREIAIVAGNLGDLYLRQAAYEQAQASFRRSLNIAERMGDLPIACVNYGNLGVLAGRLGNLVDAEHLLRRALALAERVGDPVYHCLWLAYLAFFLQEAGKDEEARGCILCALTLSRAKTLAVCAGFALVTLGQMRLAQARAARAVHERSGPREADTRLLRRARATLLHALANDELETEMRVEGQTALAEVLLSLGEPALAEQYARLALTEARRAELTRLAARAEWLLDTARV